MDIGSIFVGWLLGMLSPVIVNRINKKYKKVDLKKGLNRELDETRHRLICTSYLLGQSHGEFNKEYLKRILPMFEDYKGNESNQIHIDTINMLLNLNDNEFLEYVNSKRALEGSSLSLKKISITFTEMNLLELSIFDISFQSLLYELRTRISILNDEIGKVEKFNIMTFDSTITDTNHQIITNNIKTKYVDIQNMTDRVVSKINEIIDCSGY